jgi:protein TonB
MKKRFIIPALCALLFHAALLLGSRPVAKTVASGGDSGDTDFTPLPPIPDEPIEAVLWDPERDAPTESLRKGNTDVANPSSPDRSPFVDDRSDFRTVSEPVVPTDKHATTVIDPGVIGVPEGVPDGLRLDGGVFNAANLDRVPRALAQIPPRYPAEARMKGLSGEVVVEFNVDESGNVSSVRVVRSTSREFDAAALAAVRKWRFEPGRRHGRIVRFSMVVPVVFRLNA